MRYYNVDKSVNKKKRNNHKISNSNFNQKSNLVERLYLRRFVSFMFHFPYIKHASYPLYLYASPFGNKLPKRSLT